MDVKSLVVGAAIAFGGRALLSRALLLKFSRDVKQLNGGVGDDPLGAPR